VSPGAIVLATPLYVAGWSYLYHYYRTFGVNVSDLNLSTYQTMIYSIDAIPKVKWVSVVPFAGPFVLVVILLLVRVLVMPTTPAPGASAALKGIRSLGGPLIFLVAFLVLTWGVALKGAHRGDEMAREDMKEASATHPIVALAVDPGTY
jgi:hypothetical protein